jgi:hypothetical protein
MDICPWIAMALFGIVVGGITLYCMLRSGEPE